MQRERLKSFAASINSDLQLLTLKHDVKVTKNIPELAYRSFETPQVYSSLNFPPTFQLVKFLEEQSFNSILKQLENMKQNQVQAESGETAKKSRKKKKKEEGEEEKPAPVAAKDLPVVYSMPKGVTVVQDPETAKRVAAKLNTLTNHYHAVDTEAIDIDLSSESPVGHGKMICFSIYCGSDVDFGNGPRIWVDTFGSLEGLIVHFKEYFENPNIKKVWHNYSFDRHLL